MDIDGYRSNDDDDDDYYYYDDWWLDTSCGFTDKNRTFTS